jgi:hypothetical protein
MKSNPIISFTVNGKPPKKSDGSCWGNKEAKHVIKLREKALEARREAGLDSYIKGGTLRSSLCNKYFSIFFRWNQTNCTTPLEGTTPMLEC